MGDIRYWLTERQKIQNYPNYLRCTMCIFVVHIAWLPRQPAILVINIISFNFLIDQKTQQIDLNKKATQVQVNKYYPINE